MCNDTSQQSMSQSRSSSQLLPPDQYKHGNLVSMKLHNFMTFDDLDLSAGANLNFVLGPNGTGKSAVVCGLIIGLGGEASHTGRPGTLGEYIQFGKQECSIKIEIFNERGRNYIIERTLQHKTHIKRDGTEETSVKSDWTLNGKKAKREEVKDMISSLNIFTDNLCQFLPQEKVVEFCKLNKQELLLCTEKAVGNIQMYEDHCKLIELSAVEKKNFEEIKGLDVLFQKYDDLNKHYEQQVRVIRERKETEDLIKLYQMKKPWLEYGKAREEHNELKARANEIERRLQEKKNKLPFDRIIYQKQEELKKLKAKLKDKSLNTYLIRQNDKLKQDVQKFESNEKDEVYSYNMQFKKVAEQQKSIDDVNKEIRKCTNQLEQIEDEASLREQANKIEDEIKAHVEANARRHDEKFKAERDKQKIDEQLLTKKTLLKRETNVLDQRMQVLRQADEKIFEITKWLDRNQHHFQGKIYPPMMLAINAKKPEYINIIENLIPKKDMLAFLCTDDRDITKFNELVHRDFSYRVSVLTTPNDDLSRYIERRDERLLEYFEMFASDLFTCPDEIMAYLFSQVHLHEIPVNIPSNESQTQSSQRSQASQRSQRASNRFSQASLSQNTSDKQVDLQEIEKRGLNLRRCIANSNIYTIQRSEYDGEMITEIRQLQPARLLCGVQNEDLIRQYKEELSELELQLREFSSKFEKIQTEFKKEQQCMEEDKGKLNIITSKLNSRSQLEHKIKLQENKLKTLQEFRVDLDKEKDKLTKTLQEITRKKIDLFQSFAKQLTKQIQDDTRLVYDKYNEMQIKKQITYIDQLAKRYEEQFHALEEELKQSKELQKEMKKKCDQLFKEAHKATGTDPHTNLPKSIRDKFDKICDNLEGLNAEIRKFELKLVFSSDNIDGQNETQRLYTENLNNLRSTKSQLDDLRKKQQEIVTQKSGLIENWVREINALIDQISEKFQVFMRRLNFDGYVKLYKDANENDFEKYGISIFVRYRDEEECAELGFNKHSGGEKSVATMIYIIALQKLTAVPFRVVDEINQGMDDTNERNVLKLIMDLSKEDSSQYFILSPKLVSGLTFNEKCDFQFIFNGAFNFANF